MVCTSSRHPSKNNSDTRPNVAVQEHGFRGLNVGENSADYAIHFLSELDEDKIDQVRGSRALFEIFGRFWGDCTIQSWNGKCNRGVLCENLTCFMNFPETGLLGGKHFILFFRPKIDQVRGPQTLGS